MPRSPHFQSAGGCGARRFIIDWKDAADALDKLEAAGFPI